MELEKEFITQKEYIEWYREKAALITKATGARLLSFDPGFCFWHENTSINLPTSFVVKLSKALKTQ